jgi:hypothetical protein
MKKNWSETELSEHWLFGYWPHENLESIQALSSVSGPIKHGAVSSATMRRKQPRTAI